MSTKGMLNPHGSSYRQTKLQAGLQGFPHLAPRPSLVIRKYSVSTFSNVKPSLVQELHKLIISMANMQHVSARPTYCTTVHNRLGDVAEPL